MSELTRESILNMPAGREMDALVAEWVFGYDVSFATEVIQWSGQRREVRDVVVYYNELVKRREYVLPYSTGIATAWRVIEQLIKRGEWQVKVGRVDSLGFWLCEVGHYTARADTAPLAICRAALLAVCDE